MADVGLLKGMAKAAFAGPQAGDMASEVVQEVAATDGAVDCGTSGLDVFTVGVFSVGARCVVPRSGDGATSEKGKASRARARAAAIEF